jgi:hypothetical protein
MKGRSILDHRWEAGECVEEDIVSGEAAQEAIVVTDPSPWADFWAALQAPLAVFVMAVLGLLGSTVSYYARKIGGVQAEKIANGAYQILLDQAAGWVRGERKEGEEVTIDDAVNYLRHS